MRLYFFFFTALFLLTSCSSVALDEVSNLMVREKLRDKLNLSNRAFENYMLLQKRLGVFILIKPSHAPSSLTAPLAQAISTRLAQHHLFPSVMDDSNFKARLAQNPKLKQKAEIYFDTLSFVAVSDRDLSNAIGKALKLDQFFLIQLDQWPAQNTSKNQPIRFKARLVDAYRGDILWTGIAEEPLDPEEFQQAKEHALKLVERLTEKLQLRFRRKWHRLRYNGLKGENVG